MITGPARSTLTTTVSESGDYEGFCRLVRTNTGLDLSAYKRTQMERRIRAMSERAGIDNLLMFWKHLAQDPAEVRQFLDRVTINVSEFMRNPEKFDELRTTILPELLRARRSLLIWSAGCSYGAEVYSLKILLHQLGTGVNHRLLATDIDTGILAKAREGVYCDDDLKNVPDALRKRYFTPVEKKHHVAEVLREGVEFKKQDLLHDAYPTNVDLILCRNVVIYFTEETKSRLFAQFYQALRPGGYLLVGSTERIFDAAEIGFSTPLPFFYQRPGLK